MSNYSENQIIPIVLQVISNNPGIRTSELINETRKLMKPNGEYLDILNNRDDDKFSQKVRNIKSHNSIINQTYNIGTRNRQWFLK